MKYIRPVLMAIIAISMAASIFLGYTLYKLTLETKQYEEHISHALLLCADLLTEVRQLSTHARAAVIMNDLDEELAFRHILDIREERIRKYQSTSTDADPESGFFALFSNLGFTAEEEQELRQFYKTSTRLSHLETKAMNLAKGLYPDAAGNYTVPGVLDREQALQLLFSEEYSNTITGLIEYCNTAYEKLNHRAGALQQKHDLQVNILLSLGCTIVVALLGIMLLPLRENTRGGQGRRMLLTYGVTMLLLLCSVAVPAWLIYSDARQVIIGTMEQQQLLLANEICRELELRIKHSTELAVIAAARPCVQEALNPGKLGAEHEEAILLTQTLLREMSENYKDVASAVLLNRNNQLVAQGMVNKDAPVFTKLPPVSFEQLLMGQPQILTMPSSQGEELLVAVPVFQNNGTVNGVVIMVMDRIHALSFWNGRMSNTERVGLFIIDQQGIVIISSLGAQFEGRPIYSPLVQNFVAENRQGHLRFFAPDGGDRMGFFLRIKNLHWVVGVTTSYTQIDNLAGEILERAAFFACASGLLAIGLATLLLLYFTRTLRRSNERTENIIQGAGMFTWDYDVKTRQLHHNAQFCHVAQMPGTPQDGTISINWLLERLHPEDKHLVTDLTGKLDKEFLVNFEFRLRMPTGEYRWLANMGRVEEVDLSGYTLRVAGTGFDVHARKTAEISEEEYKQRLEQLVEKRTQELLESRNQAEAASLAKSTFLSTVSHEIRTPMNAILGFTHLFNRNFLDEEQLTYLDKIKLSADTLLHVINDVLDISKIEAGKLELECVPFNLQKVLQTVHSIAEFGALEKQLSLTMSVADNVPTHFHGDPKRLSQILLNLVNNALKFTHQGSVKVDVRLAEEIENSSAHHNGVLLTMRVTDTGIGLSQTQMGKLFKPFSQADSSVTRQYGGTGLGLAISKELVELMGGTIGVESTLGQGASFFITLRLREATAQSYTASNDPASSEAMELATSQALQSCAGARILVVEDNSVNQEIARLMLENFGMIIQIAENGQQALSMVKQNTYDLILMDMQMPIMGGEEATRNLRKMGNLLKFNWLSKVPIIAMTANVMNEDRQRCLEAGMNDHLAKPFDPLALQGILVRWLQSCQIPTTEI